ncbi:hypothetical protein BGZ63DRAFT_373917 [Mariannaea sp. PMI_226]|nr:hypothetical protein BGZ63DRAFT_373917 [Mariannaea sp. PMI_226]
MPADQDVYRKVGRGGAGNYYAPNKADEELKDLEAQNLGTTVAPPPDRSSAQLPTRAGRGGAGNYVDPANMPDAKEQEAMADKTAAAIAASLKRNNQFRGGLGGRGGAGNWREDADVEELARSKAEDEKTRRERMEQEIRDSVDKGLKLPERAFHTP